jgi:hypothetical protein
MKEEHPGEHPPPANAPGPMATRSEQSPAPRSQQDEESLLFELAWLIIDGARAFRRLRRITVRI